MKSSPCKIILLSVILSLMFCVSGMISFANSKDDIFSTPVVVMIVFFLFAYVITVVTEWIFVDNRAINCGLSEATIKNIRSKEILISTIISGVLTVIFLLVLTHIGYNSFTFPGINEYLGILISSVSIIGYNYTIQKNYKYLENRGRTKSPILVGVFFLFAIIPFFLSMTQFNYIAIIIVAVATVAATIATKIIEKRMKI